MNMNYVISHSYKTLHLSSELMMQSEKHTLSFCFSTSIGHGMNMIKYLNGVYPLSSVLFIQEINLEV